MISGAAAAAAAGWHQQRPTMETKRKSRQATTEDEFDVYFARAAAAAAFITSSSSSSSPSPHFQSPFPSSASSYATDRCLIPVKDVVDYGRHDSLPDIEISLLLDDGSDGVQPRSPARTSSCRYPHRRSAADRRKGSSSPSSFSSATVAPMETPPPQPRALQVTTSKDTPPKSGVASSCLRAPSSRQELRCHSAPHSRSSSWKKIKRPVSFRDLKEVQQMEDEEEEAQRRRGGAGGGAGGPNGISLEEAISAKLQELKLLQADDCYVVRQFTTSSKGIVNRGDSIKRRASSTSCSSSTASKSPSISPICPAVLIGGGGGCGGVSSSLVGSVSAPDMPSASAAAAAAAAVSPSLTSARRTSGGVLLSPGPEAGDKTPDGKVHVLVLGDEGVGKTSLLQQFMTSEYMAAVQTSFDDECEKTLSVLLDGEETLLEFVESDCLTAIQDCRQRLNVEVYIFVYSLTARDSFKFVVDQLHELRENSVTQSKPAIVVANKTDLVRTRQVTEEEGREVSRSMDCGYWEVSTVLNHQLDELLVGIVTVLRSRETHGPEGGGGAGARGSISGHQRRLMTTADEDRQRGSDSDDNSNVRERNCMRSASELIRGLFRRQKDVSRSCEYLL